MEHVRRTTDGLSDTEWQVRDGKRSKGKPKRRWYPSMAGELHGQEKQRIDREVEGSGGGLLPAVKGHSLSTRYYYYFHQYIWFVLLMMKYFPITSQVACLYNKSSTCEVLIKHNSSCMQEKNPNTGFVPLHTAAMHGNFECVKVGIIFM